MESVLIDHLLSFSRMYPGHDPMNWSVGLRRSDRSKAACIAPASAHIKKFIHVEQQPGQACEPVGVGLNVIERLGPFGFRRFATERDAKPQVHRHSNVSA